MQDQLIQLLKKNNIEFIDLYGPIRIAFERDPKQHWFWDDAHPYKIGHKFIGEYLAERLRALYPEIMSVNQ